MAPQPDVFISYAADTKPLAEELTRVLQREGIPTWADFKDLKPGQLRREEIEKASERAQSFVILLSPHSRVSHWKEAEWQAALTSVWSDPNKMILPVMVGGNESPPFLRNWVPLSIEADAETAQWTSQVLQVLRSKHNEVANPDMRERQERFDELERAAEEWSRRESDPENRRPDSKP